MKTIHITLIAILIIFNIVFIIQVLRLRKSNMELSMVYKTTNSNLKFKESIITKLKNNYIQSIQYNGAQMDMMRHIPIKFEREVLIVRLSSNNCHLCIDQTIKAIEKYSMKIKMPVIILANFPELDALYSIMPSLRSSDNVYLVNNIDIDIAVGTEKPLFFILDNSNHVKGLFSVDYEIPDLTEQYFKTYLLK